MYFYSLEEELDRSKLNHTVLKAIETFSEHLALIKS